MRFHEMHEQLCFPFGARQIHLPDIYRSVSYSTVGISFLKMRCIAM